MEYFKKAQQNQKNTERINLILFSVYALNLCIGMLRMENAAWMSAVAVIMMAAAWTMYLGKYRNYRIRATFTAIIMQIIVVMFIVHVENLIDAIPTFMVAVLLVSFYSFSDLLALTLISGVFIAFYHAVALNSFAGMSGEELLNLSSHIGNILCEELVLYIWIRSRNERNEQMYQVLEALVDAEKSKDDFLANVSHEIRTPVNTICGMSEMTLREHDPEKMRDEILDIRDAGHNLMSLVSDILDFSQLQQGKMDIEEEAYNITSTINDVINMAMARKENRNVELIVDCDAGIPSGMLGDEKKIRRVIMNMVNNAIKFTNEGGIIIRIHTRKEDYGVNLCVSIKDTGIGMSDEALEKVFESFSQVDSRRNRQEGGVGLGLAISRELVQKMGGTITVRSKLGKGSRFNFVVPQKVVDEKPIVEVIDREKLNIAAYFDMEQFDMMTIRDEYTALIMNLVRQLRVKCHACRNLAELKRREEIEPFTHIFISLEEYQEDTEYFDELARRDTKIIVVIERYNEKYIANPNLIMLYKPFYILSVVSILNGRVAAGGRQAVRQGKFTAPDAHVLVVDDNRMNIRVVEGLLREYQIKVTYATSGYEALELIENMNYDFVFMDHMMPEMDGIETLHCIREKVGRYYQQVPIIALTANAAPGNREMFLEEGFDDFVEKPLEISVLERVLKRNLPEEKLIFHDAPDVHEDDETEKVKSVNQTLAAREKEPESETEKAFEIGDLDTEKGLLYCGTKSAYLEVLENCYIEGADERSLLEKLYENKDWKNYVIKVHALKSTMKSIGAIPLFEMAKALESAGRNSDIEYITQNHQAMLDEHRRVMKQIAQSEIINERLQKNSKNIRSNDAVQGNVNAETGEGPDNTSDNAAVSKDAAGTASGSDLGSAAGTASGSDLGNAAGTASGNDSGTGSRKEIFDLEDEEFDLLCGKLEDAAYSLNGGDMLAVVNELGKYKYHGIVLEDRLDIVIKKIEKSDYMSALDSVTNIGSELKKAEKGGMA